MRGRRGRLANITTFFDPCLRTHPLAESHSPTAPHWLAGRRRSLLPPSLTRSLPPRLTLSHSPTYPLLLARSSHTRSRCSAERPTFTCQTILSHSLTGRRRLACLAASTHIHLKIEEEGEEECEEEGEEEPEEEGEEEPNSVLRHHHALWQPHGTLL